MSGVVKRFIGIAKWAEMAARRFDNDRSVLLLTPVLAAKAPRVWRGDLGALDIDAMDARNSISGSILIDKVVHKHAGPWTRAVQEAGRLADLRPKEGCWKNLGNEMDARILDLPSQEMRPRSDRCR